VSLSGSGTGSVLESEAPVAVEAHDADGVTVSNMTIRAARSDGTDPAEASGIVFDGCGSSAIRGVTVGGFSGYGIWIRNQSFLTSVESCHLPANGTAALCLDTLRENSRSGNYVPNLVSATMAYGGGEGFVLNRAVVANLVGCTAFQTRGSGFHFVGSASIVLSGSRTFQISGDAVVCERTHELNITGNIFCWHTGVGISITDCAWGAVSGNDVIDTSSWNSGKKDHATGLDELPTDRPHASAIVLKKARGFTIGTNAIFNWAQGTLMHSGVVEHPDCYDNIISGNTVNYYQHDAVRASGRNSLVGNNIAHPDSPYAGPPREPYVQSFEPTVTAEYVKGLLYPEITR
jgi:hypothetical protein